MATQVRVTAPLLDVLEVFLRAVVDGEDLTGWAIMKETKRSGPTVYGVLDRLEDAGWISAWWEDQHAEPGKPRHRFYKITPNGLIDGREILHARRPKALLRSLQPTPRLVLPGWLHVLGEAGAQ
jgi:DNA-binding PadR family transcriptional regulator